MLLTQEADGSLASLHLLKCYEKKMKLIRSIPKYLQSFRVFFFAYIMAEFVLLILLSCRMIHGKLQ